MDLLSWTSARLLRVEALALASSAKKTRFQIPWARHDEDWVVQEDTHRQYVVGTAEAYTRSGGALYCCNMRTTAQARVGACNMQHTSMLLFRGGRETQ